MQSVARLLAALALACVLSPAAAQQDAQGCKNHPMFPRMPKYAISQCEQKQFDAREFAAGPALKDSKPVKVENVEGAQYYLVYEFQGDKPASALQIQRNFTNAVTAAGGTVIAEFGPEGSGKQLDDTTWGEGERAAVYRINKGGKDVWVQVHPINGGHNYILYVAERGEMKQDMAVKELVDAITKAGFISLYINFDTGKANIKPDSFPQLDKVVDALKQSAQLKLEVGGHTDNVGQADANLALSDARAKSVMKYLVDKGVPAARLTAKGYGQTSPIADNRTEDGRAKNRRVDLVKKG